MNIQEATTNIFNNFNQQDTSYFESLLNDQSKLTVDGGRSFIEGKTAITQTVSLSFVLIPDLQVKIIKLLSDATSTMTEVIRTGTHSGELSLPDGSSIPPTNKKVFLPEIVVLEFENECIREMRVYTDQLDTQRQFGLLQN